VFLLKIIFAGDFSQRWHSVPLWMWVKHQQITPCLLYRNTLTGSTTARDALTMASIYRFRSLTNNLNILNQSKHV